MKRIIALIPARGGSKRIPNKNIVDLAGKPLIWYTIKTAKKSKYIDDIYVSTEDEKIKRIVEKFGAKIIDRPKSLAKNTIPSLLVLKHAVDELEKRGEDFDFLIFLQPTSPLRRATTIDRAIKKFITLKTEALYSLVKAKTSLEWLVTLRKNRILFPKNVDFRKTRTQDQKPHYRINGAIYIFSKRCIKVSKDYPYSENNSYIIMNEMDSVDIDASQDLRIAEIFLKSRSKKIKNIAE